MSTVAAVVAIVSGLLAVAGMLGVAWAVLTAQRSSTFVTNQRAEITDLRASVEWERRERDGREHACNERIAELRGRVQVLEADYLSEFVEVAKATISATIRETMTEGRYER